MFVFSGCSCGCLVRAQLKWLGVISTHVPWLWVYRAPHHCMAPLPWCYQTWFNWMPAQPFQVCTVLLSALFYKHRRGEVTLMLNPVLSCPVPSPPLASEAMVHALPSQSPARWAAWQLYRAKGRMEGKGWCPSLLYTPWKGVLLMLTELQWGSSCVFLAFREIKTQKH